MHKVLIASSNISSNIGNDFFYRGIKYALSILVKDVDVFGGYFLPYNAYKLNEREKNNNFDYFSKVSGVDLVVIAGPVLDVGFGKQFEAVLKQAELYDVPVAVISAGGRKYDEEEIDHCKSILKKYPPKIFISRDHDTYKNYNGIAEFSYDGICFAFFANDYFNGYPTKEMGEYLVSCFDFAPEPDLGLYVELMDGKSKGKIIEPHTTRSLKQKFRYMLQKDFPDKIGDLNIIRTCHRPHRNKKLIFFRKKIVSSFISDPYLNLYKNAELTVTDRLHAAVVTLSFGNKACLVLNSNRTRLLDRAGVEACVNGVYQLPADKLLGEKKEQLKFLKNAIDKSLK